MRERIIYVWVLLVILLFTSFGNCISIEGVLDRMSHGTYGETVGRYLYVLSSKITIYDASDSVNLENVNSIIIPAAEIKSFQVRDSLLYMVASDDKFYIYSLRDTVNPVEKSHVNLPGYAGRRVVTIVLNGDYAYLPARIRELQIVNISNPSLPVLVGEYDCDQPRMATVYGEQLFVTKTNELIVLNISSPTSPTEVGRIPIVGSVHQIMTKNERFYMLVDDTVKMYNILSGRVPRLVKSLDMQTATRKLIIRDDGTGLLLCDTMLTSIIIRSDTAYVISTKNLSSGTGKDIVLKGKIAFAISTDLLHTFDVSRAISLRLLGTYGFTFQKMKMWGPYVYVLNKKARNGYLGTINISDKSNPFFEKVIPILGQPMGIDITDTFLYFNNAIGNGIQALYIRQPSNPQVLTRIDTQQPINTMDIQNFLLYAITNDSMLLLDVIHPLAATILSRIPLRGVPYPTASNVVSNSGIVYAALSNDIKAKIFIIDAFNPWGPLISDSLDVTTPGEGFISEMILSDDKLFLTKSNSGLRIYDVSNPFVLNEIASESFNFLKNIYVCDSIIYAVNDDDFLLINFADLGDIRIVESYNLPYTEFTWGDVYVRPPYAYVANGPFFYIFDVSEYSGISEEKLRPKTPEIYSFPNPFNARCVIDLSSFNEPIVIEIFTTDGRLIKKDNVSVPGKYIWEAEGLKSGIYFVKVSSSNETVMSKITLIK